MGYYTRYDLSELSDDQVARINELSGYNFSNSEYNDECKWYDYDAHMRLLSLECPGQVLELSGEGEEQGDSWRAYYLDGKSQMCEAVVTFEPFDESKLK